jgi:DNA-binding transcriptional ArsR family regulator
MDAVFKALADPSRRKLLDELRKENGQTLSELCEHLDMTRQAVTKHLVLLKKANLIAVVWRGREKLHYLNPIPLHEICERWIGKYERHRLQALSDLKKVSNKRKAGKPKQSNPMKKDQFVYVTYIRATPEKLWESLIEPEFTRKFWCDTMQESEWKRGGVVVD